MPSSPLHDDIITMFKDQFPTDILSIETAIEELSLNRDYHDNIAALFRLFHNQKAICNYLNLDTFHPLVVKAENVLSALREQHPPIEPRILTWLTAIKEQFILWSDEMDLGLPTHSPVNPKLLKEVLTAPPMLSPSKQLRECILTIIDTDTRRAEKVRQVMTPFVSDCQLFDTLPDFNSMTLESRPHICLLNLGEETINVALTCTKHLRHDALLVVCDTLSHSKRAKLSFKGINHTLANPIRGKALLRELLSITSTHFCKRRILVTADKVVHFIQTLQPLRDTIFQIQQICDDEEIPVKELIKVVKHDPTFTATLLAAAHNPIYGLKHVSTIDQAVAAFGKRTVKGLLLSELVEDFLPSELRHYGIDETIFSQVAAIRLQLMIKWYTKISIAALSVLSSTAILGNIGQLLLAREITSLKDPALFPRMLQEHSIQETEEHCFHTTSAFVSADILCYWKLQHEIIDTIRYSDYPQAAPEEIRHYCIANHIVYRLVGLDGTIHTEIPDDLIQLMEAEGLTPEPLQKALMSIT